jgi:hypothetical protein
MLDQERNPRRAEAVLGEREKRVAQFNIRALSRREVEHFAAQWKLIQERFVEEPYRAVAGADELITETMRAQGYPVADFEQNAADLSVEHPRVVANYRVAHEIAARDERASTEDLRRAMLHYRSLFEEMIEMPASQKEEVRHGR